MNLEWTDILTLEDWLIHTGIQRGHFRKILEILFPLYTDRFSSTSRYKTDLLGFLDRKREVSEICRKRIAPDYLFCEFPIRRLTENAS